jgi:prefoldin subunit 5
MKEEKTRERTISGDQLRYVQNEENQKLQELIQQRRTVENILVETSQVQESVKALQDKGSDNAIIPLGGGIFVEGKITPKTYKRTLPGNVVLAGSREQIEKDLEERKNILEKDLKTIDTQVQKRSANIQNINNLLREIQKARIQHAKQNKR